MDLSGTELTILTAVASSGAAAIAWLARSWSKEHEERVNEAKAFAARLEALHTSYTGTITQNAETFAKALMDKEAQHQAQLVAIRIEIATATREDMKTMTDAMGTLTEATRALRGHDDVGRKNRGSR